MAEEINPSADGTQSNEAGLTRRSRARGNVAKRSTAVRVAGATATPKRPATAPSKRRVTKPLRSLGILAVVGGLIATTALPAVAAMLPNVKNEPVTLQQMAADDAQSLVVGSDTAATELNRGGYAATTQQEIDDKKAEEAAAAAAAARARLTGTTASVSVDLSLVAPGSGEVRWPLTGFTVGDRVWSRGGSHMGTDMLTACGTPIFAAAAGVVRVSQESYGGYGVAVSIDHVIGGQVVGTLYGHMTYGSRVVSAGQTVEAGQIIGLVGSTGRSTACHLHFETYINGSVVDSYEWLIANAG